MQAYAVKLLPGHEAAPEQIVDGHLGYLNVRQIILYDRGGAIRKAKSFGGKIVKVGKQYSSDERKILVLKKSELFPSVVNALGIKKHKIIDMFAFREDIKVVLRTENMEEHIQTELMVLDEMVIRYEGVIFV